MQCLAFGLCDRTAMRSRTLIAADGHVWMWPGIALTVHRGGDVVAKSAETIRFWVTRLDGPEALHTEAVHSVEEVARRLTRGDEASAQRCLDIIGLDRLTRDGAALAHRLAKSFGIDAPDLPLRSGSRVWMAPDLDAHVSFLQAASTLALLSQNSVLSIL